MERLRHYISMIREIEQLDRRICALQAELDSMSPGSMDVADTVTKGKKGKKPLGVVKIEGGQSYEKINRKKAELAGRIALWKALKAEAEAEVADVEKIIAQIEDPDTRRMVGYYCLDGKPNWDEVAAEMGEGWTAGACRIRVHRLLKGVNHGKSNG